MQIFRCPPQQSPANIVSRSARFCPKMPRCLTATIAGLLDVLLVVAFLALPSASAAASPNFGPNVYIFNPSMPLSQIQATVNTIATQQVPNQFGTQRYALLFEPGTYGSSANPLIFQVAITPVWLDSACLRATSPSMVQSMSSTNAPAPVPVRVASRWSTSGVRSRT